MVSASAPVASRTTPVGFPLDGCWLNAVYLSTSTVRLLPRPAPGGATVRTTLSAGGAAAHAQSPHTARTSRPPVGVLDGSSTAATGRGGPAGGIGPARPRAGR